MNLTHRIYGLELWPGNMHTAVLWCLIPGVAIAHASFYFLHGVMNSETTMNTKILTHRLDELLTLVAFCWWCLNHLHDTLGDLALVRQAYEARILSISKWQSFRIISIHSTKSDSTVIHGIVESYHPESFPPQLHKLRRYDFNVANIVLLLLWQI